MKKDIHPKYYKNAKFKCACGNVIVAGSTIENQSTDICSKCHPFYTGEEKLIGIGGRVDKFKAQQKKALEKQQEMNADNKKNSKEKESGEKYLTVEDMKALKKTGSKKKAAPKKAAKAKAA